MPAEPISVVDCDIHNVLDQKQFRERLPARWRQYSDEFGSRNRLLAGTYPRQHPAAARTDALPPSGLPPGGDLEFMRSQHLDKWKIERGVLNSGGYAGGFPNAAYAEVYATTVNDLTVEQWLEPEPRLCAGITIPWDAPEAAAAEIERWGDHPSFVQVAGSIRSPQPLGKRAYWPIYRAAVAQDLPIGLHFGGNSNSPISGAGQPSFYTEEKAGAAIVAQDQIVSFIFEGVFEAFPTLKVVLIETGFGFLPSLMWRMDRAWRLLASENRDLTRLPSDYLREHFWVTTQPIEEPPEEKQFVGLLEQMQMDDRLLYSSDYPHWDFDSPARILPRSIPADLRRRILGANANALYRFETSARGS